MNRSKTYSPIQASSRRWRLSPHSVTSTSPATRSTGESIRSKTRSLLSRITTCSSPKTPTSVSYYSDEAETPLIFYTDQKYPIKEMKKDRFVDPFESKPSSSTSSKNKDYPPVSFEIVGTIRYVMPMETIIENEQEDQHCFDHLEATARGAGRGCNVEVSSPTLIKIVGSLDCSFHSELDAVRLFPDDHSITDGAQNKIDREDSFESFSFDGVNFDVEDDFIEWVDMNIVSEDESLELWTDSEGSPTGFVKAKGFQSHDWCDDETE